MAEQNSVNFNSADFTINSGVFDLNDAVTKSVTSDSGSAIPSTHVLTVTGTGGVTTSATGSTLTIDGSGVGGGAWVLLSTATANASATLDFTSDIDSTYDNYVFEIVNLHPATDSVYLSILTSTDGGSNYAASGYHYRTSTILSNEAAGITENTQSGSSIILSGTASAETINNSNDSCLNGVVQLFKPSDSTYRHFIISDICFVSNDGSSSAMSRCVGAQTSPTAINAIRFILSSGNIDAGVIRMYGIVNS